MEGAHALALAVERQLGHPGLWCRQCRLAHSQAGGVFHQRALGGLPFCGTIRLQLCVGAKGHRGCQQLLGAVAALHLHPVLGQGSGLVGADHLCAAQRLHRREPADHCTLTAHPGHPHRKHDGHHCGQPLRHRRYRQTYRHQKGVQNGGQIHAAVSPQAEPEQKHANGQHQRTQGPAQARQRLLQRCLALCGLRQRPGNAAHLGVHSGGGDQKLAPAIPHGAAQIGHAAARGQRSIRPRRAGVFFHRQALTGEGGFLGAQADAFHEPPVRRNRVPRLQQYHVPRHQLLAGHLQLTATPQHPAVGCCHLLQRLNGLLGLAKNLSQIKLWTKNIIF